MDKAIRNVMSARESGKHSQHNEKKGRKTTGREKYKSACREGALKRGRTSFTAKGEKAEKSPALHGTDVDIQTRITESGVSKDGKALLGRRQG